MKKEIIGGLVVAAICAIVGLIYNFYSTEKVKITGSKRVRCYEEVSYKVSDLFGDPNHFQWLLKDKNDRNISIQDGGTFIYSFSTVGNYTLELRYTKTGTTITDDYDDLSINVLYALPEAQFSAFNPVKVGDVVTIVNESKYAVEYHWDFGDNSELSYQEVPEKSYDQPGEYLIKLIAINKIGEKNVSSQKIIITEKSSVSDNSSQNDNSSEDESNNSLTSRVIELNQDDLSRLFKETTIGDSVPYGAKDKLLQYLIQHGADKYETKVTYEDEEYELEEFVKLAGFIDFSQLEVYNIIQEGDKVQRLIIH